MSESEEIRPEDYPALIAALHRNANDMQDELISRDARVAELEAVVGRFPKTKDGVSIGTNDLVWWVVPEDSEYWGVEVGTPIELRVMSIYDGLSFEDYRGTHTIGMSDLECGNLELYSTREAAQAGVKP